MYSPIYVAPVAVGCNLQGFAPVLCLTRRTAIRGHPHHTTPLRPTFRPNMLYRLQDKLRYLENLVNTKFGSRGYSHASGSE